MAKVTYDPEVKILNIRLNKRKIADTDEDDGCIIDYDSRGNIVNIEIMDVDFKKIFIEPKRKNVII